MLPTCHIESLVIPAAELPVDVDEVRRLAQAGPRPRWQAEIDAAIDEARQLARPQACWRWLSDEQALGCLVEPTPVRDLLVGRRRCGFVATIGPALPQRIQTFMDRSDFLRGVLLDAAGSRLIESFCNLLERHCAPGGQSQRFSPGYCDWTLRGQRPLFDLLQPACIGVSLKESMLMEPVKTVSGLLILGDPEVLRVPPQSCKECDARGCERRAPGGG